MSKHIHIFLNLDSTIAYYESAWRAQKTGPPIPKMVENVKKWLTKGYKVTIFTARLARLNPTEIKHQEKMIQSFLAAAGLPELPMTAIKLQEATHFIDDKAYHVVPNTGEILNCPEELL